MPQLDLVVRGGLLTTEPGSVVVDIGILDGRIVQLGGEMQAIRELDARGRLLLPGGVDAHVHLSSPTPPAAEGGPAWVDDFLSGSAAALAGGITSLGNMTFPTVRRGQIVLDGEAILGTPGSGQLLHCGPTRHL